MLLNAALTRIKQHQNDILCIELDSDSETHLFRHASEITKETKGGYFKGKIIVPKSLRPCYLRLSVVPAEPDYVANEDHIQPNLLHINLRPNRKTRYHEHVRTYLNKSKEDNFHFFFFTRKSLWVAKKFVKM